MVPKKFQEVLTKKFKKESNITENPLSFFFMMMPFPFQFTAYYLHFNHLYAGALQFSHPHSLKVGTSDGHFYFAVNRTHQFAKILFESVVYFRYNRFYEQLKQQNGS